MSSTKEKMMKTWSDYTIEMDRVSITDININIVHRHRFLVVDMNRVSIIEININTVHRRKSLIIE
jgi:hypothetical protein